MTKILRNYQLLEVIASGGMGTVYRGVQLSLKRPVAVKELHRKLSGHEGYIGRFEQEAMVLGAMFNENIVGIIDYGRENGTYYIVMEYIDGLSLSEVIDNLSGLDANSALTIIEGIAKGLAFAHSKGIVHRDIKPANIIISKDGIVKISDFGLCRAIRDNNITQHNALMGTPRYMSPEQALGKSTDHRSDIYSLGILFFELLTGFYAIWSENIPQILYQVVHGAPLDVKRLPQKLNKSIIWLVQKMTMKKADERFADCNEILSAIRKIRNSDKEFHEPQNLSSFLESHNLSPVDVSANHLDNLSKAGTTIIINHAPEESSEQQTTQYFKYFGSLYDFQIEDYIARYDAYYEQCECFHQLLTAVSHNKNVLCIGRPASGKTRCIMEVLSALKKTHRDWTVIIPKPMEPENRSHIENLVRSRRVVIVWDDIDQFASLSGIKSLIASIMGAADEAILIGGLRSGDEFADIETSRTDWLFLFDTRINIADLSDKQAQSLAQKMGLSTLSSFDGTPGSIVLDLSIVKSRYSKFPATHRSLLKALKALNIIGIKSADRRLLADVSNSVFNTRLDRSNTGEILHKLLDNALIKRNGKSFSFYHSTYTEKVVKDYDEQDLFDDIPQLIKVFEKQRNPHHIANFCGYLSDKKFADEAISLCSLAIAIKPDYAKAYSIRGFLRCNIREFSASIEDYAKAVELDPENSDYHNNLGVVKSHIGDFEGAIQDYNQALKLREDNPEALFNRGTIYQNLGLFQKAVSDYDRLIYLTPDFVPAYINRAIIKTYDLNDYNGAKEDYDRALEIDDRYAFAFYNRGNLYLYHICDFKKAIADYNEAISIKPDLYEAWYNRGLAYLNSMDINNSVKSFSRAIKETDWGRNTLSSDEDIIAFLNNHIEIRYEFSDKINGLIFPEFLKLDMLKKIKKGS